MLRAVLRAAVEIAYQSKAVRASLPPSYHGATHQTSNITIPTQAIDYTTSGDYKF